MQAPRHMQTEKGNGPQEEAKDVSDNDASVGDFKSPFDFPVWRKWILTVLLATTTLTVTFASSVFSSTITVTSAEFGVSDTVMILGVSLYVLGFAIGPIVWGPLSELKGRKLPLFGGFFVFAIMQIPVALAHNLPTILICRLLAGCFGAAPVVLVSAMYADFWAPADRGTATAVYSAAVYAGPTLGPIVGAFLTESHLGWRWTAWVTLIMSATAGPVALIFVPETYGLVLRERAAKKLRIPVGGSTTRPATREHSPGLKNFVGTFLTKPAHMLACEPMLVIITLYISIVYGILYLTFYAYPYSFTRERGWDPRIGSLPFLSILLGVLVASLFVGIYSRKYYQPRLMARGRVLPEDRLPPMMIGSVLLPGGLFWFAWTSSPSVSWVPQVVSGFFIGAGIMLIFTNGVAFIVDIYLTSAASAMAANTCIRSFVAAGFPLAAPRMYKTLGTAWATSVLGFLCVAVVPAPILFYIYGHRLRQMSKYAPTTQ